MPERTDISPRGLAIGAAIILAGIAASVGFSALIVSRVAAPATGPSQDLAAFNREKNARLASYGRVDEDHLHIPIERAMRILAGGRER